ncbi:MAG TPA: heme-binding domain-containing protein [Polyangia bacterium]|nr:heme-binding domain-containing protein [Polyangia bacterium]
MASAFASRHPRLMKVVKIGILVAVVVGVAIQFVPVKAIGSNPPARYKLDAPPEVEAIMRRACYDCHSNETKWPIYARIAPGSWLMARDITKGRSRMNISEWGDADADERQLDKENSWDQIEEGNMPKWFYVFPFHPAAKLSAADKATLKAWLLKDKKEKEKK